MPEQAARLERRIMQQAKNAETPSVEMPQKAEKAPQKAPKQRDMGHYWDNWRAFPLAACLLIAFGGGFWVYQSAREAGHVECVVLLSRNEG